MRPPSASAIAHPFPGVSEGVPERARGSLRAWWESSSGRYLSDSFGEAGAEIEKHFAETLFPPGARPAPPDRALPIAFLHLRLLAGEELGFALGRLERLAARWGVQGAKPSIGVPYLMLAALTSRPGKLSSMAKAQSAFFSLLLRRLANMLDEGADEGVLREELSEVWEIRSEAAADAALEGARGLWRRSGDSRLGLAPLPVNLEAWLGENGLAESAAEARRMYRDASETPHLSEMPRRLAAIEALGAALESAEEAGRRTVLGEMRTALRESLEGAMEGMTPWESEILRPVPPLLRSLLSWADRLRLLDEGETPTAHPGRERLPDWLENFPGEREEAAGVLAARRFIVGGETYIAAGVNASAPSEALSVALAPPTMEAGALRLNVRFGREAEKSFPFRLENGRDLLAALYLAAQDDLRLDFLVRGADGIRRFGASAYPAVPQEHRAAWLGRLLSFLEEKFGGEEGRIRLEILKGVKGEA